MYKDFLKLALEEFKKEKKKKRLSPKMKANL